MSLPIGSTTLSSITPANVYYLTGATTSSSIFLETDYTTPLGKPLENYTINSIDPNIIKTISAVLPATVNNITTISKTFHVLSNDDDITIGKISTDIEVTFVSETAQYLNALGYYFYHLDPENDPVLLTNDPSTNVDSSIGYYYPTIIFPNASRTYSGGSLTSGGTRRLRGNMPDGSFQNINVGFFLISNGWSISNNGQLTTGTGYIQHTTNEFNANYDASFVNLPENGLTTDYVNYPDGTLNGSASDYRRGIQSVLLYYITANSWI